MSALKAPSGYQIEIEDYELPSERKDLYTLIQTCIEGGSVQRLVVQSKVGVRVSRLVKSIDKIDEEKASILSFAKAYPIVELEVEENKIEYLNKAIKYLEENDAHPRFICVGKKDVLTTWSGSKSKIRDSFLGLIVVIDTDLSEDVAVIVGTDGAESDYPSFSVKLLLDVER